MSEFNLLFASPLFRAQMEPQSLAGELAEFIVSHATEDRRHPSPPQRRHEGVFESTFDFLTWDYPVIEQFRNAFFGYVARFVKAANDMSDEEVRSLRFDQHCWFHLTTSGGYFQPHNHANASWSAVYCVSPGDATPVDDSHAGHIVFDDPRSNMFMDAANRNMRRDLSFNAVRLRLTPGEIVIFPSYLLHWVEPYTGDSPRITIAANFWFNRRR